MKHLIFLIFIILVSSVSADILTDYRQNGLRAIEKELDLKLTDKNYWKEYLKAQDTSFGYIEKYENILICDKSKHTLSLYVKENGKYKLKKTYSAYTGKKKGDKVREGDLRTPIGIYNLTKKISKLDSFYGPLAFVTSYPNFYDKIKGKDGSGIWIHGVPADKKRNKYTKGCIALENKNIKFLDKIINIDKTLLIISPNKLQKKPSDAKLTVILTSLYKWRYAWIYNDINNYIKYYSTTFKKNNGTTYKRYKKYKTRVFKKNEQKSIIFKNLTVIPYPNSQNIFQITFDEDYKSDSLKFNGEKKLLITLDKSNSFKIFLEK